MGHDRTRCQFVPMCGTAVRASVTVHSSERACCQHVSCLWQAWRQQCQAFGVCLEVDIGERPALWAHVQTTLSAHAEMPWDRWFACLVAGWLDSIGCLIRTGA